MRPVIMKVYGNLYPVDKTCFEEVEQVLTAWNIEDSVFYEKDMVRISYEGEYFPCDEVSEILKSYHAETTEGKLDCMDLEEWTLARYSFKKNKEYKYNKATLDKALEGI